MGNISLLDCTLRDGGYINNWEFGKDAIIEIIKKTAETGVDILEIGFLKNEAYSENRTIYSDISQISAQIHPKKQGIQYAAMIEMENPILPESLPVNDGKSIDIIRFMVWKRSLKEAYDYCKIIVEKGYKLYVQPVRVDQYSDDDFVDMLKLFRALKPRAIYVVDSFGSQYSDALIKYLNLADKHLPRDIAVGYHGHNNMMQVFGIAEAFLKQDFARNIMIDASVYGIGRGAGNLNLEVIADFLNKHYKKNYNITPMLEIFEKYIKDIYRQKQWGFAPATYSTGRHNCNPNYADYFDSELKLPPSEIDAVLQTLAPEDKIRFFPEIADKALKSYLQSRRNG